MVENSLEQYKNRVDEVGKYLLDAISSIALGNLDVDIDVPEDINELADLAVGIQYMIEDLKKVQREQAASSIEDATKPTTQDSEINKHAVDTVNSLEFEGTVAIGDNDGNKWLPIMAKAIESAETVYTQNGDSQQSLALPIQVQDEVIGVIGFDRDKERSWTENEIATVEAVIEQVGLALENQRLIEQTQQALAETDLLYQASADINTTQLYEEILAILRRSTLLGQNSHFISLNLFNAPWTDEIMPETLSSIARWTDASHPFAGESVISLNTWSTVKELLQADSASIITDIPNDKRMDIETRALFMGKHDANMVVFAPLVTAGQWIGTAIATYQEPTDFLPGDLQRLTALSAQAASVIQNIRLVEETTRRANQLETAAEIAREASRTLDVEVLLDRAVNLVRDRFGYYHASIFLIEGDVAVVRASTGEAGKQLVESRHSLPLKEGGSIIGHVSQVGEPLVVNDVTKNPTHRPHPLLPNTEAELGIPLKVGNRILGALDVQSTQANSFTADDIAVLEILSDQIAIAVENARSYEVSQEAVEEMREIDRLKSQFLANMSHELRTPLNSIIGFSRVILKGIDGPINDMQKQDLDAIYSSGQHLLEMINSILDLSKIEAGKMELSIEEIQLNELIASVISTAMGLVKEKPITIINKVPENTPTVHADRTRVRQILLNLLQNAAKFTDEGSITVNLVEEISGLGAPIVVISVTDTGMGISAEDQQKLFEPFSQVDDSPTRKTGGSGLGLSISRRLVEMQGGDIWLESAEGAGSTFFFSLPIAGDYVPQTAPVISDDDLVEDKKIIISVDDDAKVIDLYNRYLGPHGYKIISITDPTKALEQIRSLKPFAITLDIMMPKLDGWQVIEKLKSDPETKDIPIVICSILDNREKGYELGATDYLIKPILEDELVEAINSLNLKSDSGPPRILMVDDDRNAMRLVNKVLSNQGKYQLSFAEGGLVGLSEIQSSPPDAVILDLFMPDLDGFSLLQTIRTDPALKDLPVIVLTGGDLTEEQLEELSIKKESVLRKDSLNEKILLDCLNELLDE